MASVDDSELLNLLTVGRRVLSGALAREESRGSHYRSDFPHASEAFRRIGIDSVQLHGAVGYTAEYDIQLYLKRSKWASPAFGDAAYHRERYAVAKGF